MSARIVFAGLIALLIPSLVLAQGEAETLVPEIATTLPVRPGVDAFAEHPALPDLFSGSASDWPARRAEWRALLEYYATGHAPAAPAGVTGKVLKSSTVLEGAATYQLVRLEFGPDAEHRIGFDIAIFIPAEAKGSVPVVIFPSFDPTPGGSLGPRLPRPPGQGKGINALLPVANLPAAIPVPPPADLGVPSPETVAARHRELLARGYALVTYDYQQTGEDTTLRLPDGSWAFRTTGFFPAYPGCDWGLVAAWAWGMSRVADYVLAQPFADPARLIVTGHSRLGKATLVAGAYDPRFALVAPTGTGGGGSGAYRFSGAGRGGKEGLDEMMHKYPNWFSPHLHQFRGHVDRLPFDQHAFIALVAPRAFIALEGTKDGVALPSAVSAALLGARAVFSLLGVEDQIGANYAEHNHQYAPDDWRALLDFADWRLRGRDCGRRFPLVPPASPLTDVARPGL